MPALHRSTRRAARLFAVLSAMVLLATNQPASAAPGRVAADPSPVTISEGDTTSITVTLNQPTIAETPDPQVVLDLTIGDPARIALSTYRLVFAATEWQVPQTLTVSALDNATHDLTPSVTVTGVASSASLYYDGYRVTITVNILDNDPVPTTTTPPSSTTPATTTPATTTPATTTTQPVTTPPPDEPTPTTQDALGDDPPETAPRSPSTPASPVPATTPSSPTTSVTTTTITPDAPAVGAVPPSTPVGLEVAAARTTTRSDGPIPIWVLVTAAAAAAAGPGAAALAVKVPVVVAVDPAVTNTSRQDGTLSPATFPKHTL